MQDFIFPENRANVSCHTLLGVFVRCVCRSVSLCSTRTHASWEIWGACLGFGAASWSKFVSDGEGQFISPAVPLNSNNTANYHIIKCLSLILLVRGDDPPSSFNNVGLSLTYNLDYQL